MYPPPTPRDLPGPDEPHDWIMRRNDEGDLYEVCLTCGKQTHWEPAFEAAEAHSIDGRQL